MGSFRFWSIYSKSLSVKEIIRCWVILFCLVLLTDIIALRCCFLVDLVSSPLMKPLGMVSMIPFICSMGVILSSWPSLILGLLYGFQLLWPRSPRDSLVRLLLLWPTAWSSLSTRYTLQLCDYTPGGSHITYIDMDAEVLLSSIVKDLNDPLVIDFMEDPIYPNCQ